MPGVLELLRPNNVLLQQRVGSKKRALQALSDALALSYHEDDTDSDLLLEYLTEREQLGSTGLGGGIAIPHCRLKSAGHSAAALLTLTEGVDFDAEDGQPVDIFVALAVTEQSPDEHVKLLGELATLLQNPDHVRTLREQTDPKALLSALAA